MKANGKSKAYCAYCTKKWKKVEEMEKSGRNGKKWKKWKKVEEMEKSGTTEPKSPDTAGAVKNISDNPPYYICPKELQKELRLGAALSPYLELRCRCRATKFRLLKFYILKNIF